MRRMPVSVLWVISAVAAHAQHLWWSNAGREQDTCLYGEITVLETEVHTYFCGANWHPGEAAGGYCGIQNTGAPGDRVTICSVWDTAEGLVPEITHKMPGIKVAGRFGGEGTGAQTLADWPWKVGETFRFYAWKRPGKAHGTTDLLYFVRDNAARRWVHMATITSPDGGQGAVRTLTNINSFLENYGGDNRDVARLALYRLWSGKDAARLRCITQAEGDGEWGQLGGAYFLASGSKGNLAAAYARWRKTYGEHRVPRSGGKPLGPIPDQRLPLPLVEELRSITE